MLHPRGAPLASHLQTRLEHLICGAESWTNRMITYELAMRRWQSPVRKLEQHARFRDLEDPLWNLFEHVPPAGRSSRLAAAVAITKLRNLDHFRGLEDPLWILLRHCYTRGAPLSPRKMVDLQTHLEHPTADQKVGPGE